MKSTLILGVVGALLAGTALAQPPRITAADTDGDDAISREEFEAARLAQARERFTALDTDSDGKLTQDELRAARGRLAQMGRDRMENVDTDGDGAWSLAEMQAVRPGLSIEQFNRLDRNGDGLIGADERPQRGGRHAGPGRRGGPEGRGGPHGALGPNGAADRA